MNARRCRTFCLWLYNVKMVVVNPLCVILGNSFHKSPTSVASATATNRSEHKCNTPKTILELMEAQSNLDKDSFKSTVNTLIRSQPHSCRPWHSHRSIAALFGTTQALSGTHFNDGSKKKNNTLARSQCSGDSGLTHVDGNQQQIDEMVSFHDSKKKNIDAWLSLSFRKHLFPPHWWFGH
uniref:Uncharacterized protein n=1 Tax=Entomoneis paludosa TaxID=265537 RepID=A0A7S2V8Y9_9STRA|mmetsp:Transcript_10052/g.20771  ORF Transcript_10052/g.20771 Transcript_10052/m.20771 type:complete len:180 (+) Transcript_10052:207-746(+)